MRQPDSVDELKGSSGSRSRSIRPFACAILFLASIILGGAARTPGVLLAAEPAEILLYTRFIEWRAAAGTPVEAILERRGREIAAATADAGTDGAVVLAFTGTASLPIRIEPADVLVLEVGGSADRIEIPEFRAGIDAMTDIVAGAAPAGTTVSIQLAAGAGGGADPGIEREVTADSGGRFQHAFTGEFDIRPGTRGDVEMAHADGNVYRADIRALSALVTIGWPEIEVRGTPGELSLATVSGIGRRPASGSPSIIGADGLGSGDTLDTVDRAIISLRDPIAAGDSVTVTRRSEVLPEVDFKFDVPEVSVAIDVARRRLRGTAPSGGSIEILLRAPDGTTHSVAGISGSDGRFDISAPDAPLGPGWQVEATWDGGLGLQVRAIGAVTSVTLGMHTPRVLGIARPLSDVLIMLFTAAGERVGPWRAPVDREGRFTALLIGRDGAGTIAHRIKQGDVVQFDFADGDPISVLAPSLTARVDADTESIVGEAPPGADLVARFETGLPEPVSAVTTGTADAAGGYRLAFGEAIDIEPPAAGTLSIMRRDGHVIEVAWASVAVQAEIGGARVEGNAAPEREVHLTVQEAGGAKLATAATRAITPVDGVVRWSIALTDSLGTPLRLAPGDIVSATVGDESVAFTLPPLDGVIHVADDIVAGRTAPNTEVAVIVDGPSGERGRTVVVSDATGTFAHDFTGTVDIRYNDRVDLIAAVGRHSARREVSAPGVMLDLGAATVSGSIEPGVSAKIDLVRGGDVVGSATALTGADATFSVQIRDSAGRPIRPELGDKVVIMAPLAGAERRIELDVPELTIALDPGSDRVSGTATVGGALDIALAHAFEDGALKLIPDVGADGTWDARDLGDFDLQAGSRATATLRLPSGHLARRAGVLTILNVAYGLDLVCGQADPLSPVSMRAIGNDGAEFASASATVDGAGTFAVQLAGAGGSRTTLDAGDTVIATFGTDEQRISISEFTAELDSARSVISGTVPAGAAVTLVAPIDDANCRGRVEGLIDRPTAKRTVADARGSYAFALRGDVGASIAQGFEIAYVGAEQHRVFRAVRGLRAEVHVYRNLIEGRAAPRSEIAGRLIDGSGETTATGTAITRSDGSFALQLKSPGDDAVVIGPGDIVELVSTTLPDRIESIRVEHLVFDIAGGGAIVGSALSGRTVDLTLSLIDGRRIETSRLPDDDGSWSFGPTDVPFRSEWNFEDIARVRARVEIEGTHAMVAEAELIDAFAIGRRILLPQVFRAWP